MWRRVKGLAPRRMEEVRMEASDCSDRRRLKVEEQPKGRKYKLW